jgi:hypothetical protein
MKFKKARTNLVRAFVLILYRMAHIPGLYHYMGMVNTSQTYRTSNTILFSMNSLFGITLRTELGHY